MTASLRACAVLLFAVPALAQDVGRYNEGLSAFNSGNFESAAKIFNNLDQTGTDAQVRLKSQYYLGDSLFRLGMPAAAMSEFFYILSQGPKHPFYLKGVEGLVQVQHALNDEYLIPSSLDKYYDDQNWATLPPDVLARINFLVGMVDLRKGKYDEAKAFLESVGPEAEAYAKAQYLLGVVLTNKGYPGGPKQDAALRAFQNVVDLKAGAATRQSDFQETRQLAMLALGRAFYDRGQYPESTNWYDRVPRFSKFWDQALFENGWARFQNDDYGGALGSLQSLHAPQFQGAFQPESWILKATAYYFACLYDEAKAALRSYEEAYQPMAARLKPLVEAKDHDNEFYYQLFSEPGERIPRPVLLWIGNNARFVAQVRMIREIDQEKQRLAETKEWADSVAPVLLTALDGNRATLVKVAGHSVHALLQEALGAITSNNGNAEIVRFETSKAEKEIYEQGVDLQALRDRKHLYRPQMPAEDWNYWKFQGEFWIDEIGYYQYTLKKACPEGRQ